MEERNTTGGTAAGLMNRMKASASSQIGAQKDRATDGLGSVAQAVRQSTRQLRDQQHDTIAAYVEQAADQIERFAGRLKDRNVGDLAREAQELARRRPVLFVGSAFALGVLGARFLKSSADRDRPSHATDAGRASGDAAELQRGGYGDWPGEPTPVADAGRLR